MTAETPGQRLYLIRLALGDGVKNPLPLKEFSALLKRKRQAVYDPSTLSRMENGHQPLKVDDINTIAPLDPHRRGRAWLACWDADPLQGVAMPQPDPTKDLLLTDDDIERARLAVVRKSAKKSGAHRKRRGA